MATDLKWKKPLRERLPPDVLRSVDRIADEDLTAVKEALIRKGGLKADEAESAERELKRFFAICLMSRRGIVPREGIGPTKRVDAVWHAFILHTEQYAAFCQAALGGFLHHAPVAVEGDGSTMRDLLKRYFDDIDTRRMWKGPLDWCVPE